MTTEQVSHSDKSVKPLSEAFLAERSFYPKESQAQSAFRYLTSPFRASARASLEGIALLSFYRGTGSSPLLYDRLAVWCRKPIGEDRRSVAHSPSWRRRYGGRKPPSGVKCPPSTALSPWAAPSCFSAPRGLHTARYLRRTAATRRRKQRPARGCSRSAFPFCARA